VSEEVGVSELVGEAAEDLGNAGLGVVGHENAREIATVQTMRTTGSCSRRHCSLTRSPKP
jgi:hypothetical protein